jgi:hypothetical protein
MVMHHKKCYNVSILTLKKRLLGRQNKRGEESIKMDLRDIGFEDMQYSVDGTGFGPCLMAGFSTVERK